MQITNIQKLRIFYTKGKNFSLTNLLGCSFIRKQMQMIEIKQKQLPPQFRFAILIHDSEIKPVNCLVKHETVLASEKDDCHPFLADFGNDQFPYCIKDKGEET